MADYNSEKFMEALERATGESDRSEIKKKLVNHNEDDLISALKNKDYDLQGYENFLRQYKRELLSHEDNTKRISKIQKNYSQIEDIYSTLKSEIDTALGESTELEEISRALDNKALLKKANKDEAYLNELKQKFNHLISMKEEMEALESKLEKETENFDDLKHAVERRVELVNKVLQHENNGGQGSNNKHRVISVSDVCGHKTELDQALSLLKNSQNYPEFKKGDYTLVLNGNIFSSKNGPSDSDAIFTFFKNNKDSGNLICTFGNNEQFILFKEFWCATGKYEGWDDPFFQNIEEDERKVFLDEIINGCMTGLRNGDYNYNYANSMPNSNINGVLDGVAKLMLDVINGAINPKQELKNHGVNDDSEIMNILLNDIANNWPDFEEDGSKNEVGDIDLSDMSNATELEARIVLQYKLQFEKYEAIFSPASDIGLWTKWGKIVDNSSGKHIVGYTISSGCGKGKSFFNDNSNPRFANGGNLINENTIRTGKPTLLIEEPDNVYGLREGSNGSIQEVCLSDRIP